MQPTAPVTLVGRDTELATARQLLEASRAGAGGVLVVVGEAGIGKTALLGAVAAAAQETGFALLTGRAIPGGGTYRAVSSAVAAHLRQSAGMWPAELRPFGAAMSRLAPGWSDDAATPSAPDVPDQTLLLGEGLLRLLATAGNGNGCLLILEDLHWADADTLALVGYLAGAVRTSSVLIAVSARDDQAAATGGGFAGVTIDDLSAMDGVATFRLGRLGPAEVAAIVTGRAGSDPVADALMSELLARAEGLPVVIDELLMALRNPGPHRDTAAIPPTFGGLVRRRLAGLDDQTRSVLRAVAVLGADPDWKFVADVTGQGRAVVLRALSAAVDAGLLVAEAGRLRWRHALTREAVLAGMLPPEMAAVARRAVDVVPESDDPQAEALRAELLALAGEPESAGAVLLHLARRDMARGALRSAGELIARASRIGADPGRVMIDRVGLLTVSGRAGQALEAGAAGLAVVTGDDHAELCLALARAAVSIGRWQVARSYVERAGRPADPRSPILLAEAAFGGGDPRAAADLARSAVDLAENVGDSDSLCAAMIVVGRCAELQDLDAAAAAFGRVAQHAAEHGLLRWRVEGLFGLGRTELMARGETDLVTRAREQALDAGLLGQVLSIEVILGERALAVGGPAAARSMAAATAERAGHLGLTGPQAMCQLTIALAHGATGNLADMKVELAAATAHLHVPLEVATGSSVVPGIVALLAHDLRSADAMIHRGMSSLVEHDSAAPLIFWGLWALLRTAVVDDPWPREMLRAAPAGLRDTNRGALAYADAIAAGRTGDPESAAALFAVGNQILDRQHWWRRLLRVVTLECAVVNHWGEPVRELRADLAVFERDGAQGQARTCRDLLRQAGVRTRRGRGSGEVPPALRALGITSRETDVLRLVQDGLPNAQIAARLFLSPRTVETHVANLLAKTGTEDRGLLREFAADRFNGTV